MKLLKLISILALTVGLLWANPINLSGKKDGYDVTLTSDKSLVVGDNIFFVTLSKDGKALKNAKVKAKFFMPEMPGMPYMEYVGKAKLVDGKYKMSINLSMSGTWQLHIFITPKQGKKSRVKTSLNF